MTIHSQEGKPIWVESLVRGRKSRRPCLCMVPLDKENLSARIERKSSQPRRLGQGPLGPLDNTWMFAHIGDFMPGRDTSQVILKRQWLTPCATCYIHVAVRCRDKTFNVKTSLCGWHAVWGWRKVILGLTAGWVDATRSETYLETATPDHHTVAWGIMLWVCDEAELRMETCGILKPVRVDVPSGTRCSE